MPEEISLAKSQLRKTLIALRSGISERSHQKLVEATQSWLLENAGDARCVGFWRPIRGEPDVLPALKFWAAQKGGRTLALPVVLDRTMAYYQWSPQETLTEGSFGIKEPAARTSVAPDLLLIPCVGADRNHFRLGYGGGFFDRFLAQNKRCKALGVCFSACVVDRLPLEGFDRTMDAILTENGSF